MLFAIICLIIATAVVPVSVVLIGNALSSRSRKARSARALQTEES